MKLNKKGQDPAAGGAAGLVVIIAIIIILYLLVIPPQDRADIITNASDNGDNNDGDNDIADFIELIDESPGSLFPNEQRSFEHPMSQVVLSSKSEDRVLYEKPTINIMESKLDSKTENIHFSFDVDSEELTSAILSFTAETATGVLSIELNGGVIYEASLMKGESEYFRLPVDSIRGDNYLKFSVSRVPWFRFFGKNAYKISNLKIIGGTRNTEDMTAITTILLSEQEVEDFEDGYIRFTTECTGTAKGTLKVHVNDRLLSSSLPACMGYEKIDLVGYDVKPGRNTISFELTDGVIYLTNFIVRIQTKEARWPLYYFEINESLWQDMEDEDLNIILKLEFVDEGDSKEAEYTLNGRKFYMDTRDDVFKKDISSYVRYGNNYVKIIPESEMHVVGLKVYVEKED